TLYCAVPANATKTIHNAIGTQFRNRAGIDAETAKATPAATPRTEKYRYLPWMPAVIPVLEKSPQDLSSNTTSPNRNGPASSNASIRRAPKLLRRANSSAMATSSSTLAMRVSPDGNGVPGLIDNVAQNRVGSRSDSTRSQRLPSLANVNGPLSSKGTWPAGCKVP